MFWTWIWKNKKIINRPKGADLKKLVEEKWYSAIWRDYSVSGNAVKKWLIVDWIPLEKIREWVEIVKCELTWELIKRDKNQVDKFQLHFKNKISLNQWQKQNGKLADLTKEKYEEMKKTKSIRKIAEELGCHHTTLIKKFSKE